MPARRSAPQATLLIALCVFFFCSGLSALICQILWLRMFGWVFGVTIHGYDQALRDVQIENFEALLGAFCCGIRRDSRRLSATGRF